ncbi:hypothetical protein QLX08_004776 [Tetragonisca angustula]|uniref:Uncharacterized protein n=1 Tax=Tetragonisca angustula TaxID=166442 RepID=A0AAW1A0W0_9HYME
MEKRTDRNAIYAGWKVEVSRLANDSYSCQGSKVGECFSTSLMECRSVLQRSKELLATIPKIIGVPALSKLVDRSSYQRNRGIHVQGIMRSS